MTTTDSQPIAPYSDDNGTLNTGGISDRRKKTRGELWENLPHKPTRMDLEAKLDFRGEKPATNRLNHGTT
jgi:hypothetical protein